MEIYKAIMDRPLGYLHHGKPYPLNYGYIPDLLGGDGEEQDVYVLSRLPENQKALSEFTGKRIAIIHRKDDVEEKWVLTTEDEQFSKEEIKAATDFMEQYFDSDIEMLD